MIREGTAAEFSRIRNLNGVHADNQPSKCFCSVRLTYLGRSVGDKMDMYRRGKVVSTTYTVESDIIDMPMGQENLADWYLLTPTV